MLPVILCTFATSQTRPFLLRACGFVLQICQVFEHAGPSDDLLTNPATKREVLAALLATLRDTHWAAAVGWIH